MNDRCTEVRNKIEPTVEWDKARAAAAKLEALLSDEMSYLTSGNRFQNVYSPMAWVTYSPTVVKVQEKIRSEAWGVNL